MSGSHLKYWRKVKLHPWDGIRHLDISYGMSRWTLPGKRGGFWTDTKPQTQPVHFRWSGFRESARIAFTYAGLNNLQVFVADIRNAYLQAPSSQKDYVVCGPEFGIENIEKVALIHQALYGGKSAGQDFRNHLRSCMHHLDFRSLLEALKSLFLM